jgi:hypothetical protein
MKVEIYAQRCQLPLDIPNILIKTQLPSSTFETTTNARCYCVRTKTDASPLGCIYTSYLVPRRRSQKGNCIQKITCNCQTPVDIPYLLDFIKRKR